MRPISRPLSATTKVGVKRTGTSWARVDWDTALGEIGEKVKQRKVRLKDVVRDDTDAAIFYGKVPPAGWTARELFGEVIAPVASPKYRNLLEKGKLRTCWTIISTS